MPKIMIVDDDAAIQMELEEYLAHMDHTVVGTADTGESAIEMARETDPDLILMDINPPGEMDGISAAQEIKEEMDVAVVFITGFGDPEYIERAKRVEPFGYMMKPFDEREINGVVEIALYKKKMELKLRKANDQSNHANRDLKQEIQERKQTEENLEREFHMRTTLLDNIPDCIALIVKKGTHEIVASNRFARDLGAVPGQTCFKTCTMRDDICPFCLAPKLWATGQSQTLEVEYRGEWYKGIWTPLSEDLYVHYIFIITERKRAEEALRESENRFHTVADFTYDWEYWIAPDGHYVYISPSCERITGYGPDAFYADSALLEKLIHPEDPARVSGHIAEVQSENQLQPVDFRIINRMGETRWISHFCQPVYNNDRVFLGRRSSNRDITDRKQAEEALRESEDRYRGVIEDMPLLICNFLPDGKITFVNKSYCKYFGRSFEKLIESNFLKLVPESEQKTVIENIRGLTVEIPNQSHEHQVVVSGGEIRWQRWTNRALFDEQGQVISYQSIGEDITERKNAEEALRESEEKYRRLVENAVVGVYQVSEEGRFRFVNAKMAEIFGYDNQKMFLEEVANIVDLYAHAEERPVVLQEIDENGSVHSKELEFRKKDGCSVWIAAHAKRMIEDGKIFYEGLMENITEKKQMEILLRQAQKMEAIGTLSGGIAHDYNNLLSVIMGNLSIAQEEAEPRSAMAELLHEIEQASYRARDLTQQFLTLSKGGHPRKELGTMEGLLKEIPKQVRANEHIEYIFSIPDDLLSVEHDPKQIQDAITNVLINAVEAMPQGGCITIQAENQVIDNKDKKFPLVLNEGKYVRISIKDEGSGISEEHMDKIFDPYFSTKDRGTQKGMGMGLAVAQSVVQKHDAHIMIDSTTGVGTTVTIYLPAAEEKGEPETVKQEREDITPSTSSDQTTIQRILFMDDEEMLRDLAQMMLQRLGCEVETVKDGDEAIEAYQKQKDSVEPFDAVILDLTIKGGMGGEQTIRELIKIDPGVKAIVCSGYFNDPVITNFEEYGFRGAMAKPYQKADLESVLKKVLG